MELSTLLSKPKGVWISQALESEMEWMFSNPSASHDDCVEWAKQDIPH